MAEEDLRRILEENYPQILAAYDQGRADGLLLQKKPESSDDIEKMRPAFIRLRNSERIVSDAVAHDVVTREILQKFIEFSREVSTGNADALDTLPIGKADLSESRMLRFSEAIIRIGIGIGLCWLEPDVQEAVKGDLQEKTRRLLTDGRSEAYIRFKLLAELVNIIWSSCIPAVKKRFERMRGIQRNDS